MVFYTGGRLTNKRTTKVVVQDGVREIDDYAFTKCPNIRSITIPNSVTSIGWCAFHGLQQLETISIPDSVRTIGRNAFMHCTSLKAIVIPEGVTVIEVFTFLGCHSLKSITFPKSLTKIGERAFCECIALEQVDIPHGVTVISECAFINCTCLETVIIPDAVTTIGDYAFCNCTSLKAFVIPEGVTEIESPTFESCSSLKSITFPKSLTKIGERAFYGCNALEQVDIPHGVTVVPSCAFEACTSLHTVTLPPTIEEFQENAFAGCDNLKSLIIPNGLPSLKYGFDPFNVGFTSWELIIQILAKASNLTRMSLRKRDGAMSKIKDDNLPKVLELVSYCPTLREVDLSRDYLSVGVFENLASQVIPGHLRLLQVKGRCDDEEEENEYWDYEEREEWDERRRQWEERWRQWEETSSSPEYLLRVLERNPKLVIETDKFWDDIEDDKVRHHLDMNEYGCRSFTIPDSHWPELIETLALLEEEGAVETGPSNNILKKKREGHRRAANILYSLFHLQLDVLLNYQQRNRGLRLRSNTNYGSESNLATVPSVDNVDTIIHGLRGRLEQQKVEIKEKDDEIKEKDATIKEKDKEIKGKDGTIKEKDKEIKGKDATIKEKDKEIKGKDARITEKDTKIKGKDKEIKEKDNEIMRLRRLLEQSNSTADANEKTQAGNELASTRSYNDVSTHADGDDDVIF